jgi:tryptophan synthase alpha chain
VATSLHDRFELLRERGEKALVLFVTAGDPSLEDLPGILETLQEAGADIVEVGIPYSDPIADGPTIQASSQRALDRGVTPLEVLEALRQVQLEIPVVLMGYYNPLLRLGLEPFAQAASEAGVTGTIISDLTPEEAEGWLQASRAHALDNVFLVAPTSTSERIAQVCQRASGFIYAVSRTGVTGASQDAPNEVRELVERIRSCTSLPICVGFGISMPEHVGLVTEVADGAVVGSWLVNLLANEWRGGAGASLIREQVAALKAATR